MVALEIYTPTPRKQVTKKEITVKKEVKQEVKRTLSGARRQPRR